MRFACFSAAAVADEAEAGARHRSGGQHRRGAASSLRSKFFGGRKGKKYTSKETQSAGGGKVDDVYDVVVGAASATPSVPCSSALSSTLSLDSACSSLSWSTTTASCSGSFSSFSDALPSARRPERRRTPAAGAASVIVCLVMVMLVGRIGATVLASAAFYLFPRRWPVSSKEAESALASPEHDLPSATEQGTTKRKVVKEGFLVRNRKK
ncbi:hypothetical protein E2562_000919 [Oryza meyeriana var. granulata]|uniref:Uncharacterized protein n=1 Tax=Oryza meyeriana var. granulata TaxID=110450 RepID=A0A6G1CYB5_9ORYZ|nr:hypothetical protein E2562_000919 [Oryza meyeriana var. granulata]